MKFPDKLDALTIHARLIAETGGTAGLRDEGLLESALAAAENRQNYENADLVACAAAYAYHLTQGHAFVDGNKRVAAAITETFLESNDSRLVMSDEEIVQLFLNIASGILSREQIETLLREKVSSKAPGSTSPIID
jgi:death on curing protein